jgi:hypothetical protein
LSSTDSDPLGTGIPPEPDQQIGALAAARERAMAMARLGALDGQILAALRDEYSNCRPQVIPPGRLAKSFGAWVDDLVDARQAGTVLVLQALNDVAMGDGQGRVQAAVQLLKRREMLEGLEVKVRQLIERVLSLPPSERAGAIAELHQLALGSAVHASADG